jgi:hypothetical protein
MTKINHTGQSHGHPEMPKDIAERSTFEGSDVIQYSLMPRIPKVGAHLKSWSEVRKAGLGSRKFDLRMGGGLRDPATDALTKTANLARGHSFKNPRSPAAQIPAPKVKRT